MNHLFSLTPEQTEKLSAWQDKINEEFFGDGILPEIGAIGGRFTYSFTLTSIGSVVRVYDEATKQEIDLTDYESW